MEVLIQTRWSIFFPESVQAMKICAHVLSIHRNANIKYTMSSVDVPALCRLSAL